MATTTQEVLSMRPTQPEQALAPGMLGLLSQEAETPDQDASLSLLNLSPEIAVQILAVSRETGVDTQVLAAGWLSIPEDHDLGNNSFTFLSQAGTHIQNYLTQSEPKADQPPHQLDGLVSFFKEKLKTTDKARLDTVLTGVLHLYNMVQSSELTLPAHLQQEKDAAQYLQ